MNPEKLKKLQAQAAEIRIGGKGENGVVKNEIFLAAPKQNMKI